MKPVSLELLNILKRRQWFLADCFTLTLSNGTVKRYTSGDQDITLNGQVFSAGKATGPYWDTSGDKAKITVTKGSSAQTLTIDCIPGGALIGTTPFLQAMHEGLFDGATFVVDRCFMPTFGDTRAGPIRMFAGRVAEVDAGRSIATFTINSFLELANLQLPRNIIQTSCTNSLGDASCQVDTSAGPIANAGTVVAGSTTTDVLTNSLPADQVASGAFTYGKVIFTSGANAGVSAGIQSVAGGSPQVIVLQGAVPAAPAAGDTFVASWGCDKTLGGNGCPKFANQARFRGEPFVPQPTAAA
jgi:uncharacterized phage protein (TIGR02218 family)